MSFTLQASDTTGTEKSAFDIPSGSYAPVIMFHKGSPSAGEDMLKVYKKIGQKVTKAELESVSFHGGFFISMDNVPKGDDEKPIDLTEFGWKEDNFKSKSTKDEQGNFIDVHGYLRRSIMIAAIDMRFAWEVHGVGIFPNTKKGYDDAYSEGQKLPKPKYPSGLMNLLVAVQGMEHLGEFVIVLRGHNQMAFLGKGKQYANRGIISKFQKTVLAAAHKESPGNWQPREFWMELRASQNADGSPKFFVAGTGDSSTQIVNPELVVPLKLDVDELKKLYVGKENVDLFNSIRDDAAGGDGDNPIEGSWKAEWNQAHINENSSDEPEQAENPFDEDLAEKAGI